MEGGRLKRMVESHFWPLAGGWFSAGPGVGAAGAVGDLAGAVSEARPAEFHCLRASERKSPSAAMCRLSPAVPPVVPAPAVPELVTAGPAGGVIAGGAVAVEPVAGTGGGKDGALGTPGIIAGTVAHAPVPAESAWHNDARHAVGVRDRHALLHDLRHRTVCCTATILQTCTGTCSMCSSYTVRQTVTGTLRTSFLFHHAANLHRHLLIHTFKSDGCSCHLHDAK